MRKTNPTSRHGVASTFNACAESRNLSSIHFLRYLGGSLLLLAMMAVPALAQTTNGVNLSAVPVRITVPIDFIGSITVSNHVTIATNPPLLNPVTLSVSGNPPGVTVSINPTTISSSGAAYLTVTFDGTEAEGIYNLDLSATGGATNDLLIPIEVGYFWTGASGSDLNWSTAGNWSGAALPGVNDDVIFTAAKATTNNIGTNTLLATSVVDQNTTVSSVRFAQFDGTNDTQNLFIAPNKTLSITGTNGFRMLMDYAREQQTNQMYVSIVGTNASMVVSNQNGIFAILVDNDQNNTLDMSQLGTFQANVSRVGLGDFSLYPNYWDYLSNGYTGRPQLYIPLVSLARTNIIRAAYADPFGYGNNSNRNYAFTLGRNENQATGSGQQVLLALGITNSFQLDSICLGGFGAAGSSLQFNPSMWRMTNIVGSTTNYVTNTMVAIFRNTNGGRMSMFCLADAGGVSDATSGNTKANGFNGIDFASNHGYVDALVDQFIMARNSPNPNRTDGCTAQARMELGAGIFNVNTAIIGDQENSGPSATQTNINYSQGTLTVSNTATFQVNQDMELGYTTAQPTDGSDPGSTYGILNVGPGGTVIANNIGVGGTTQASGLVGSSDGHGQLNQITLSDGALLVVSNSIGTNTSFPNGGLGLFSFTDNSTLELFINGNHSGPYVYVNDLTTVGSGAVIKIGGVTNITFSGNTPVDVPLIQYATGTPHFSVSLPPGYTGTIVDNGAGNTIDALIAVGTSKSLAWRGYVNNNWDTTTKNWLDLNTGLQTNFASLDNVSFDDTTGAPATVNLAVSSITPGVITMTNNTLNYVISGSGSIQGTAPMFKTGTSSLDIEGNTTLSITVGQGLLKGAGTIFSANIGSGGSMLYSGTINGNVVCAGAGTSSGTINGTLDVQGGGVFTNLNAINNTFALEPNSFMQNSGSITYQTGLNLGAAVSSNAFLLNLGSISGDLMTNNGTLEDSSSSGITMTTLSINSGATFIPGGNGIGTTYIRANGVGTYPGRLTLNTGSTTIIKVNPGHSPANTAVFSGALDYGPSQSGQAQNGCTLMITNIDGTPFAAGQSFNIFGYISGPFPFDQVKSTGSSTNSYPVISPASPGPGLSWDLRALWPNGYVGIVATPVITLTNSFIFLGNTNIVTTFSWPTNFTSHWVLETQANPLNVGLSNNWSRIPGTWTNTSSDISAGYQSRIFTNNLVTTNPAVFYRLVYP